MVRAGWTLDVIDLGAWKGLALGLFSGQPFRQFISDSGINGGRRVLVASFKLLRMGLSHCTKNAKSTSTRAPTIVSLS